MKRAIGRKQGFVVFEYLVVMASEKQLPNRCFDPLIEKDHSKTKGWKHDALLFAKLYVLLNSCLYPKIYPFKWLDD